MNIRIKDVKKNAAFTVATPFALFSACFGVFVVVLFIILRSFVYIDFEKGIWPLAVLGGAIAIFLIGTPIVYLFAFQSKKVQKRYVQDIIETKYNYARVLRSYAEDFSKKVHEIAEEQFSRLSKSSEKTIDDIEERWVLVEEDMKLKMKLAWQEVKKVIDDLDDTEAKDDFRDRYRKHEAEMLEHLQKIKQLFESRKMSTVDEFQEKVTIFIDAREKMIAKNNDEHEASAKAQEEIAKSWEDFLKQHF